jgi:hypothetical protein
MLKGKKLLHKLTEKWERKRERSVVEDRKMCGGTEMNEISSERGAARESIIAPTRKPGSRIGGEEEGNREVEHIKQGKKKTSARRH